MRVGFSPVRLAMAALVLTACERDEIVNVDPEAAPGPSSPTLETLLGTSVLSDWADTAFGGFTRAGVTSYRGHDSRLHLGSGGLRLGACRDRRRQHPNVPPGSRNDDPTARRGTAGMGRFGHLGARRRYAGRRHTVGGRSRWIAGAASSRTRRPRCPTPSSSGWGKPPIRCSSCGPIPSR